MNNIWILLKIQILGITGINKALHSKNKKEKTKFILMGILITVSILLLGFTSFLYSFMLSFTLTTLNQMTLLPAIMMTATSIIILFTTMNKTKGILYGYKDYDIIMALPIKTSQIVASRIMLLYLMNLLFTLLIMVPMTIVYGIKTSPNMSFYILSAIAILFLPFIPIIIASFLGTIITKIALKFPHSNQINILLNFLLIIGIMGLSFRSEQIVTDFSQIGTAIRDVVYKTYPFAKLYVEGVCKYRLDYILLFIVLSIIAFSLYVSFVVISYKKVNTALTTTKASGKYISKEVKLSSSLGALYRKELKRYFSSSIYVLNTAVGIVLLMMMSLSLLFFQPKELEMMIEMPGFAHIIKTLAPFVTSLFIVLSATTASSISLEGKNLWILKTLPVEVKDIFLSKILVSMTLPIPVIILNTISLTISLELSPFLSLLVLITPTAYAFLNALLGLMINLKYPVFDWTNEVTVIKQSASVLIYMLLSFILVAIPFVLVMVLPTNYTNWIMIGCTLIVIFISYILYRFLLKRGNHILYQL